MAHKIGDLIKWHETYADINMIRDLGTGIIIGSKKKEYKNDKFMLYTVYRTKINDTMNFHEKNITTIIKGD
jgi:hypothetical protein